MTAIAQLFSSSGRLDRAGFRLIFVLCAVAKAAFTKGILTVYHDELVASLAALTASAASPQRAEAVAGQGLSPGIALAIGLGVVLWAWIVTAAHVRRLHDLGWSGWTCAAAPALALASVAATIALIRFGAPQHAPAVLFDGLVAAGLCYLVVVGCCLYRHGVETPNRFDATSPGTAEPAGEAPRAAPVAFAGDRGAPGAYRAPQDRSTGFGRRRAA